MVANCKLRARYFKFHKLDLSLRKMLNRKKKYDFGVIYGNFNMQNAKQGKSNEERHLSRFFPHHAECSIYEVGDKLVRCRC